MDMVWIEWQVLAASPCPASADDIKSIHRQGIRAIVSLTEYPLTVLNGITPALFDQLDMTYLHAPVWDFHAPTLSRAMGVVGFIDKMKAAGKPVLIHCLAGEGRTGTMLHVYYMSQGLNLDEARVKVKAVKPSSRFEILSTPQQSFLIAFAENR